MDGPAPALVVIPVTGVVMVAVETEGETATTGVAVGFLNTTIHNYDNNKK